VTLGDRIRTPAAPVRPVRGPRGRVWIYAIAFGVLLLALWLQVKGNLVSNMTMIRWSIALSIAAVIVAIVSVLIPGPRLRAGTEAPRSATGDGQADGAAASAAPSAAGPVSESGPEQRSKYEAPGPEDSNTEPAPTAAPAEEPRDRDGETGSES
jgi:hypothetical protein